MRQLNHNILLWLPIGVAGFSAFAVTSALAAAQVWDKWKQWDERQWEWAWSVLNYKYFVAWASCAVFLYLWVLWITRPRLPRKDSKAQLHLLPHIQIGKIGEGTISGNTSSEDRQFLVVQKADKLDIADNIIGYKKEPRNG